MPRRRKRPFIPVTFTLPAEPPTEDEIDAILMATDAIIDQAGRAGVVLILNGFRSQKVKRWEWDKRPFPSPHHPTTNRGRRHGHNCHQTRPFPHLQAHLNIRIIGIILFICIRS